MTEEEAQFNHLKFVFMRATVLIENIKIIEVKRTEDAYNSMFYFFYSPEHEVTLFKCYFEIYRVIIFSQTGYGLHAVIDSHAIIMELFQSFI